MGIPIARFFGAGVVSRDYCRWRYLREARVPKANP